MKAEANSILQSLSVQSSHLYRLGRPILFACLFLLAFSLRLFNISDPPLNFHATRQYRSLVIARAYYYETSPSVSAWSKRVALISKERQGFIEPPIMETLVAAGYHIVGGEHIWLSRVLSSFFWLLGGVFLYQIGKRIAGEMAAVISLAIFLFLPFGVVASRSFQPDPLMVMLLLSSIWAILRFYESPTRLRLLLSALIAALAFAVKPISLFQIVGVYIALGISQSGFRKGLVNKYFLTFLLILVAPSLAFYLLSAISGQSHMFIEAPKTLLFHLLATPFFWRGWISNIGSVIGHTAFIISLLGLWFLRPRIPRALLLGMWTGYLIFSLALNYNVATHDYYQLQLIPVVSLSIGPLASLVIQQAWTAGPQWYWRASLVGIVLLALVLSIGRAALKLAGPGSELIVRAQREIGEAVGHSTETVFLAADYGLSLEYNGLLSGSPWPLASDLEWEKLAGLPNLTAEDRFQTEFAPDSPDYFIVFDLREYEQQPDLKVYLMDNFPILVHKEDYLIFDLTGMTVGTTSEGKP